MRILAALLCLAAAKPVRCSRRPLWSFVDECVSRQLEARRRFHGAPFYLTDSEYQAIKSECFADYEKIPWECK